MTQGLLMHRTIALVRDPDVWALLCLEEGHILMSGSAVGLIDKLIIHALISITRLQFIRSMT